MTESLFSTMRTMSLNEDLEIAFIEPEIINIRPMLVLSEAQTLEKD